LDATAEPVGEHKVDIRGSRDIALEQLSIAMTPERIHGRGVERHRPSRPRRLGGPNATPPSGVGMSCCSSLTRDPSKSIARRVTGQFAPTHTRSGRQPPQRVKTVVGGVVEEAAQ
jgi:hypothetical protein